MGNKKDIVDDLEEAKKEPEDKSPDRGFIVIEEDGESVKLGKKSEKTKEQSPKKQ